MKLLNIKVKNIATNLLAIAVIAALPLRILANCGSPYNLGPGYLGPYNSGGGTQACEIVVYNPDWQSCDNLSDTCCVITYTSGTYDDYFILYTEPPFPESCPTDLDDYTDFDGPQTYNNIPQAADTDVLCIGPDGENPDCGGAVQ